MYKHWRFRKWWNYGILCYFKIEMRINKDRKKIKLLFKPKFLETAKI